MLRPMSLSTMAMLLGDPHRRRRQGSRASASQALVGLLPDISRYVEARALLFWGQCEIFGFQAGPDPSVVLRDAEAGDIFVIGVPDDSAVRVAAERGQGRGQLIISDMQAARLGALLPDHVPTRAIVHLLGNVDRLPPTSEGNVRFIEAGAFDRREIPAELFDELHGAAELSPIAASFAENRPVAFCYAGAVTETLWDVSIDTLPEFRRFGHAARAAAHMIRYMAGFDRRAVWASAEDNPASRELARKLGFQPVDTLALFTRPESS
jgi:GNAT superfamily N-acetyltransferase